MGPTQKTKKDKESGTGINAESPSFQESKLSRVQKGGRRHQD